MRRIQFAKPAIACCAGFTTLLFVGQARAVIEFSPATVYPAVSSSQVVAADFDHHAGLDLATYDWGLGRIAVLQNLGNGNYAPAVLRTAPPGARAFAAGDLDGDGDVDLILARDGSGPTDDGFISVLRNTGAGAFAPAIDYPVLVTQVPNQKLTPFSLVAVDLDGDGDLDLAVAGVLLNLLGQPGFFAVVLNTGVDGQGQLTFATSVNIDSTQSFSRSIVADDFDNDGDLDLAVASRLDNSVTVLLNDGSGLAGGGHAM